MTFLVVDDSATMRTILRVFLERLGHHQVVEAGSVDEAMRRFDESVDFVIVDHVMPERDGLDLVRSLRSRPSTADLPILMISARGTDGSLRDTLRRARCGLLVKPFTPQSLGSMIEQHQHDEVRAA